MTERHAGYVVMLKNDIREDDAEKIVNALRMVQGVIEVKPVINGGIELEIAEERARGTLRDEMREILWPGFKRRA